MRPIDYFDAAVAQHRARTALIDGPIEISFKAAQQASERIASAILALCPDAPSPVAALLSPNDYRIILCTLGIMRAGGVIMPLHVRNSLETNRVALTRLAPRVVFFHSSVLADVRQIRTALPATQWICLDRDEVDAMSLDRLMTHATSSVPDWADVSGNQERLAYLWHTSGTADEAKIVVDDCGTFDATLRTTRMMRQDAAGVPRAALVVAPLSHTAGPYAFTMLTLGATVVVMSEFDARAVADCIETRRITDMWLPPTALSLLLTSSAFADADLSSLRRVDLGAAAAAPELLRNAVERLGPRVTHGYAQIESGVLTSLDADTMAAAVAGVHPERLASSGRSLFLNRIAIMDDAGNLLPNGEVGEIVVRGRAVKRYLDPAQTAEARRFGWHHTGDLGRLDDDGFLYVVGRKKDVIVTSGFKVLAAEVERVLLELPCVHECAVLGGPDPIRGEAITAVISTPPGVSFDQDEVLAHCRLRLPRGKAPTVVERWDVLPKTSVGKIDKRLIRDAIWTKHQVV